MAKLIWDATEDRKYEDGVSHGVLYPPDSPGVVWNGLLSVVEAYQGTDLTPLYYDGIKYLVLPAGKDFQGTIEALSAPEEFSQCVGEKELVPGFSLTAQPRALFGMSYQTRISGDKGYKIHLLYNATASFAGRTLETLKNNTTATVFSWTVDCVPPVVDGYIPTAHLVVDSTETDPDVFTVIENLMYGLLGTDPILPTVDDLVDLFS